jgi:Protein of unknown function (DUF4242)
VPRYLVERALPERLPHPTEAEEGKASSGVVERNELGGVTWVHSYVNEDRTKIVSVYDAPSREAVREAAADDLPADAITEIRVLTQESR